MVIVHRTHGVDSALRFEIASMPKPGSWRIVQPYNETVELLHLAENRAAAETWLKDKHYSRAWIESADSAGEEPAGAVRQTTPPASVKETV